LEEVEMVGTRVEEVDDMLRIEEGDGEGVLVRGGVWIGEYVGEVEEYEGVRERNGVNGRGFDVLKNWLQVRVGRFG
jgi:hypothetical protein